MTEQDVIDGVEEKALAIREEQPTSMSIADMEKVAAHFMQSGLFKDTSDASQAVVKIMAGQEMGIGAFAAMRGFNIIQGQLAPNAGMTAALIKKHPSYSFKVKTSDQQECVIEFWTREFGDWEVLGSVRYTIHDAELANLTGKQNWKQYPRQMLFARALTEGARKYCGDVFLGSVYTPEELGDEYSGGDIDVIDGEVVEQPKQGGQSNQSQQASEKEEKAEPKPVASQVYSLSGLSVESCIETARKAVEDANIEFDSQFFWMLCEAVAPEKLGAVTADAVTQLCRPLADEAVMKDDKGVQRTNWRKATVLFLDLEGVKGA